MALERGWGAYFVLQVLEWRLIRRGGGGGLNSK